MTRLKANAFVWQSPSSGRDRTRPAFVAPVESIALLAGCIVVVIGVPVDRHARSSVNFGEVSSALRGPFAGPFASLATGRLRTSAENRSFSAFAEKLGGVALLRRATV